MLQRIVTSTVGWGKLQVRQVQSPTAAATTASMTTGAAAATSTTSSAAGPAAAAGASAAGCGISLQLSPVRNPYHLIIDVGLSAPGGSGVVGGGGVGLDSGGSGSGGSGSGVGGNVAVHPSFKPDLSLSIIRLVCLFK